MMVGGVSKKSNILPGKFVLEIIENVSILWSTILTIGLAEQDFL